MDAQKFLAEFGHIANAPGGVARLRELVLHLAVSGQLVEQSLEAEHAEELLERIRKIAANAVSQKRGKSARNVDINKLANKSDLPSCWVRVQLGEIGDWGAGSTPSRNNPLYYGGKIPWFKSGELKSDYISKSEEHISELALQECSLRFNKPGDVLIAMYGANIGQCSIVDIESTTNQAICACTPYAGIDNRFLLLTLRAMKRHFIGLGAGGAQPNISKEKIVATYFGLPPTEEQSRIVAKVDELMALCDTLEAQQQERRRLQNALRQSTLQALADASSPHELKTTWARLAENFELLFEGSEDVVAFKGLILDLAVSGELLSIEHRHPSSGADLLGAIASRRIEWSRVSVGQEQKEALAMLKKLRTQKIATPDTVLPENWAWATLLQVSQAVVDCHNKTAPYVSEGIHLIRTTDIRNGRMYLSNTKKISEETYAYWARRMPPKGGDIFFTREAPMGEAAIVPDGERVCLGQRSMLIRLFPELFSNRFLLCVIQSPSFQARMREAAIGMTVKHLRVGGVEDLVVPVPPRADQDRIVSIVDELFRLCDHYAAQLSRKQRIATNLADSAVSSLTGIAIEQEEEPVKAPQTELIAPLRLGTAPDIKAQAPLATILARHNGEMDSKDLWQRFGGEIDAFYAQLKTEVACGWIVEPAPAEMREKPANAVSA